MEYIITAIAAYLLGSIPFGLVLTKLAGYGDIRQIGSGNIGATNVLRTGNKPLALATLILDSGKGAIAVFIAWKFFDYNAAMIAGFFALLGHLFPVWLKFKGGKGVATTLGTLLALKPIIGVAACGLWLLIALITRYSSLSALVAIAATPFLAHFLYHDANLAGLCGIIATLVFFKHRENIRRLIKGEEPKIGKKS
jgi:acyl phosphate:glycerol-3-phosphate acyltransferase